MPDRLRVANIAAYREGTGTLTIGASEGDIIADAFGYEVPAGSTFLDVGCGNGAHMANLKCRTIGLDLSHRNLQLATERLRTCEFIVGDCEAMPLAPGSVDCVLMAAVLHHLSDWRRGMAEAVRVLKKGGKLFVMESNAAGIRPLLPLILPYIQVKKLLGTYHWEERRAGTVHVGQVMSVLGRMGMKVKKHHSTGSFLLLLKNGIARRFGGRMVRGIVSLLGAADRALALRLPHRRRVYQYIMAEKK